MFVIITHLLSRVIVIQSILYVLLCSLFIKNFRYFFSLRSHDRYNAPLFRVLSSVPISMKFLPETEINGCIFESNLFLGENISSVSICEQEVT